MVGWISNEDKVGIRNFINNVVGIRVKIQEAEVDWGKGGVRGREGVEGNGLSRWRQDGGEGWG